MVALILSSGLVLLFSTVFPPSDSYVIDQSYIDFADVVIWPLTILSTVVLVTLSTNVFKHLPSLISRFSGIKAAGYEISFSSEGAKRLSDDLITDIQGYAENAKREYDRHSEIHKIKPKLGDCAKALSKATQLCGVSDSGFKNGDWRATIYIQDVVFSDALYQLINYYPNGHGGGRRYSVRFGAIGLAWRSGQLEIWNGSTTTEDVSELVKKWGMHRAEAESAQARELAICVPLNSEDGKEAVLYIDAGKANSILKDPTCVTQNKKFEDCVRKFFFGIEATSEGQEPILPHETVAKLIKSISAVNSSLQASNPRIKIYANS